MKTNEVPQQYISKSALVAEIKRIEHETNYEPFTDEVLGKRCICRSLLSYIDNLEVKEVDLEKENFIKKEIGYIKGYREKAIKMLDELKEQKGEEV